MAPAGSFDCLQASIDAGADSIYFGIGHLNMRAHAANNFSVDDIDEIIARCSSKGIRTYCTLNTIVYDDELSQAYALCRRLHECGVSAIIASDIAVIDYAASLGMEVHVSTQANVSNIDTVRFYSRYADVIVLARELTIDKIRDITNYIEQHDICGPSRDRVRIELFVHGALCVAIAGKCHMSLALHNTSANRGQCLQVCRRKYRVLEDGTDSEFLVDNQYVMSPKDLCTIGFLDAIVDAGVSVLKIEGRGRSADYVSTVVSVYRDAVDSMRNGHYTGQNIASWEKRLRMVYNRDFWHGGYYLGKKLGEWTGTYGSQALYKKVYLGKITNYYSKLSVAECFLENDMLCNGDRYAIIGPTTGVVEGVVNSLRTDETMEKAGRGETVTMPIQKKVRRNDKLFLLQNTWR